MSSGDHNGGVGGTRQRILVTGANGQVGWELVRALRGLGEVVPAARGPEVLTAAGRSLACDLTDPDSLRQLVRSVQPTLIVNAAAHTAVDKAETEPELAMAINGIAAGVLAEEAKRIGAAIIHYSTDYVFDGSGTAARTESDPTGPLGIYGRSKLAGELAIEATDVPHAILRTSWVYGVHGHNFVKTMLRLGSEREQLSVVADQIGAPTSARAVAEGTAALLAACQGHIPETLASKGGVFHFCCGGETSWYEFAVTIFDAARKVGHPLKVRSVRAIASHEYPTPAQRPRNSRLDCARVTRTFGLQLPHWQAAFDDCFPALFQQWHASTRSVGAPHILTFPAGKRVVTQQ
jgi:dTDP-4-dehydrorhamnose reductase